MIVTGENYRKFHVGAKAENLFFLRENGVSVPPFFCFFQEDISEAEQYAATFFDSSDRVALRSSASAEDGKKTSFAGQFSTCLRLAVEEISRAARQVCAVPTGQGFREYCRVNHIDAGGIRICAIAQKMIDAELSGVIFTANPQGILSESVVVVGRGCGENVVEDRADVTAYYCNRPDSLYYSEQTGDSPLLPRELLLKLLEQADGIRELLNRRDGGDGHWDIEFSVKDGQIHILQARPVTTLGRTDSPVILDNSNIVESYPGITLPLTQSFVREAYYRVFRRVLLRLTHEPGTVAAREDILRNMVDAVNGRVYYRISNWYDVILLLPFSRRIIPVWQEMLGVSIRTVTAHSDKKVGFVTHGKVAFSFVYLLAACPRLMRRLDRDFQRMVERFEAVDLKQADNGRILAHYRELLETVTDRWDLTLVNDMYAFLYTGLLKSRLRAREKAGKIPDAEEAANRCISGINGIESMKPVLALTDMAALAAAQGAVPQLQAIQSGEDFDRYVSGGGELAEKMADYIRRYGDRGAEELKLESRTFRTDPWLLAQKIVQYAGQGIRVSERKNADAPRLKGLEKVFARRAALGIKNREKSRLSRSRLYGMMRSMMGRVGENLARAGVLARPEDIFYLTYEEVEQAVADGGNRQSLAEDGGQRQNWQGLAEDGGQRQNWQGLVEDGENRQNWQSLAEERRAQYRRFAQLPAYNRLVFAGKVTDKSPRNTGGMETASSGEGLEGIPCSGGKARGRVLVVENPALQTDTAGKILVAKMTDPGWVFLLAGAAGIVAEKGSLLSHTAIISRELGKPAVVGVENATRLLQNGDLVEIDGTAGRVTVLERV